MYGGESDVLEGENVIYYLTVYNEPYVQPAEPDDLDVDGLLRGIYRYLASRARRGAAGAAARLGRRGAVGGAGAADARRAVGRGGRGVVGDLVERAAPRRRGRRAPQPRAPGRGAEGALRPPGAPGRAPVVAVSDWMRAVPDQIRQWVPARFTSLGTDGFGLSDTRPATRRHFAVDAESITVAALATLAAEGALDRWWQWRQPPSTGSTTRRRPVRRRVTRASPERTPGPRAHARRLRVSAVR